MEWKAKRKQAQIQPEPQELPLEWSDVPGQAISNLPSSAGAVAEGAGETNFASY